MALDFNAAGGQRSFEVIPAGTTCILQMIVRPGKGSDGGWLKPSKNGSSEALDGEFTVVEGQYANTKFWQLFTLRGDTPNHHLARDISMGTLRAILESAREIKPQDVSEEAQAKRKIGNWGDFHGLRFVAQIGVRPAEGSYPAKNFIKEVITPDRSNWQQPVQVPVQPINGGGNGPMNGGGGNGIASGAAATPTPSAPPVGAVARPDWAN